MKPIPRPADGEPREFALERFLPYRLSVLTNRISRAIARVYAERFDLTIPEWRVLAVLGRFGPMTANEAAERTEMDKVRVSRAVARLLRKGRLGRRTDTADRRRATLALTAQGRALFDEIGALALGVEARLLGPLDAAERALVDRVLARLEECAARDFAVAETAPGKETARPKRPR